MADATPSRAGQVNGSGDDRALFLKVFSGEVLTAFREANRFLGKSMVRTISSGKTAQFPATGKASASYHTPGAELTGGSVNHAERTISIDDLLVSDIFIPVIDEAMSHYEYRSEYSTQAGRALSRNMDQNLAQVGALAARASTTVTGLSGGSQVELGLQSDTDVDPTTGDTLTAQEIIDGISSAAQALDEKDVPDQDRYCFLSPQEYRLLTSSGNDALDRDFNDANGSVASGRIFRIGGVQLVKTNHLPSSNVTSGPTAYQGDFRGTVGLVMHRSAIGTVKLIDLASEMAYDIRRQGTLVVAKMAVGHGILRPESAVELTNIGEA